MLYGCPRLFYGCLLESTMYTALKAVYVFLLRRGIIAARVTHNR